MNALIFDTETTGLPNYKLPINHPDQPHIVQLAAILTDENGDTKAEINFIIKPDNWIIPNEVSKIHGITTGDALEFGVPIAFALNVFMILYQKADYLVAHNIDFDLRMLRRYSKDLTKNIFEDGSTVNFCTMKAMTEICKLDLTDRQKYAQKNNSWSPDGGWPKYKSPTLSESYWHIFSDPLDGAHNAMVDTEACKEIFYYLNNNSKDNIS